MESQLPPAQELRSQRSGLDGVPERVEARIGKIPVAGRYHRLPRSIKDDYQVSQRALGSGCNGEVWLATRPQTSQRFAVKALGLSGLSGSELGLVQGEVENFLGMDHPHIARLHDVYESESQLCLVMECMEGGELYDRVIQLKGLLEHDAADTMWQILLAVNYIHSHGVVHRDLTLENFLFDKPGGRHLKLIDFGFSKRWDSRSKMHRRCGSLSYVAPEVLRSCYTSQCDMWSVGVLGFILLSGVMPFCGPEEVQYRKILRCEYVLRPERWVGVSQEALFFVQALLEVDPQRRLTAQGALECPWLQKWGRKLKQVDASVVKALHQFSRAPKLRRCCMEVMAWSLSKEERAKVMDDFLSMDTSRQGTITSAELQAAFAGTDGEVRQVLSALDARDEEVRRVFAALDYNHDQEIHYSDFLAAMISTKIDLSDELMHSAFQRFDTVGSGCITAESLREVLGDTFEGEGVESLLCEADRLKDQRISYPELVAYLQATPAELLASS